MQILSHLILKNNKHTNILKIEASVVHQRELIEDHQRGKILFWGTICWAAMGAAHNIQDLIYYAIVITLKSVQQPYSTFFFTQIQPLTSVFLIKQFVGIKLLDKGTTSVLVVYSVAFMLFILTSVRSSESSMSQFR